MISLEKGFYHLFTFFQIAQAVLVPAETFFSHGTVKALDVGLFILTVGSSNPVTITEHGYILEKVSLKFWPAISLDKVSVPVKSSPHALEKKPGPVFGSQRRRQQDIGLFGEDIDSGEGVNATEVHRIHLHYLSRYTGFRYQPSLFVLLPPGADDVLLG